jgi:hypothetical protein
MSTYISSLSSEVQYDQLTRRRHGFLHVVRKQNAIDAFPFVLLALVDQTALFALELAFLVFVEAFWWNLFAYFAAAGVSLVITKCWLIRKGRAAAMTLDREEVAAIEVLPDINQLAALMTTKNISCPE